MPAKRYVVRLTGEERNQLESMVKKGKAAYKIRHANILLKADADGPNWKDADSGSLRLPPHHGRGYTPAPGHTGFGGRAGAQAAVTPLAPSYA